MISILQAIILGIIQGFTELFPISSLGHSVIIPSLLGWHIDQDASYFLTFLVATHLATAIALLLFFWRDWAAILKGLGRSIALRRIESDDVEAKLGWLLIVATIPAGILGILLQKHLTQLFGSARIAAGFLIINGCILFIADRLQKHTYTRKARTAHDTEIAKLSWTQAIGVGLVQSIALLPGISRSGSSMAAGLRLGLTNEDAARFSFLLATPVIGAAALLKLPELFKPSAAPIRSAIIAGAICAGIAAFLSVRFLVKYFETKTLRPFAYYCIGAGIIFSLYLALH